MELGVSYSCDRLSRALGDPAVVLSFRDNHLIEETGGGSLGGSVLQCSRNYSWRSSLNLVLLFVYERNPCVKSFSA